MKAWQFEQVYVHSYACCGGPLEAQGPCRNGFDHLCSDLYAKEKSFEKAEIALLRTSCDLALRKGELQKEELDACVGGDLMNQLLSTHYFARELCIPTIGVYAACATSSLAIATAAQLVENGYAKRTLAFTSSHNATAERQYRFPNEYGVQKKETTTTTVTGAGSVILSTIPSEIQITRFTAGRVVDWRFENAADMGSAMAPAAFDTLRRHLSLTNTSLQDYDWVLTGDLSKIGLAFLQDLLKQEGYAVDERLNDCGLMIYDIEKQPVFCGGSGCACSMCVTLAEVFRQMKLGKKRRVLVVATGALLSPIAVQQKESIPCIAHAIEYQRRDTAWM